MNNEQGNGWEMKIKIKRLIWVMMVVVTAWAMVSCRSQQNFGQRKAPKNCHTCTKWGK